ncbi:MAG: hypothetical protein JWP38_225 [Herbaspirillum sp.]|nr:hypothetical protein [Herbaspirillum sp.]
MLLAGGDAAAQTNGAIPAPTSVAGTVTHLSGVLTAKNKTGTSRILAVKSEVIQGDTLITAQDTYARVKFTDDGELVLRPGSQLVVANYAYDALAPAHDNVVLNLLKGGLRAVTGLVGKRNHDAVTINTPTATIGIRGTHFGALFCQSDCGGVPTASGQTPANGLHVDVAQGAIVVQNASGSQVFNAGQFGYVSSPNAPPVIVPPAQSVQVTMPPAISQNGMSSQTIGAAKVNACMAQ